MRLLTGIQTYLRQCRISGGCSMLSGTARSPPVVVELLYNVNVRMLKQERERYYSVAAACATACWLALALPVLLDD